MDANKLYLYTETRFMVTAYLIIDMVYSSHIIITLIGNILINNNSSVVTCNRAFIKLSALGENLVSISVLIT